MNDDYDIDWLATRRPNPAVPSAASTDHARSALIAHGDARRRARRRMGALAAASVVAAATVAVVLSSGGGAAVNARPHVTIAVTPPATPRPTPPDAQAAVTGTPPVRLAADVHRLPSRPQPGDATLVVRDTFLNGQHMIVGRSTEAMTPTPIPVSATTRPTRSRNCSSSTTPTRSRSAAATRPGRSTRSRPPPQAPPRRHVPRSCPPSRSPSAQAGGTCGPQRSRR